MTTHEFDIVLDGVTAANGEAIADALYGAGCDDAVLATRDGISRLSFDRDAGDLLEAILTAMRDVARAVSSTGVRGARVEPDDLVSIQDIAMAIGVTRQHIHLLVRAERGPGAFPPPAVSTSKRRYWRWPDVLDWIEATHDPADSRFEKLMGEFRARSRLLAAINGALQLRRHAGQRAGEILERMSMES